MPVAWVILPEKYELLKKRGYTYGAHCMYLSPVSFLAYQNQIESEQII